MELSVDTKSKLRDMGAGDLLDAFTNQDDDMCMGMSHAERVQMAVDEAYASFVTQKIHNLTKRANLRYPEADVRSINFEEERGLDRIKITELATCSFVNRGTNVVLQGFTGTGKTYLACAIAKEACKRRMRSCYVRMPDFEEQWQMAANKTGGQRKLIKKYSSYSLLVLDEWLLNNPSGDFREALLELMENRYGVNSTIFCTQFHQKDWHAKLGGNVYAEAIMDRIIHNTVWVEMGEMNMRAKLGAEQLAEL